MRLSEWARQQGIDHRTALRLYHQNRLPAGVSVTEMTTPAGRKAYIVDASDETLLKLINKKLSLVLRLLNPLWEEEDLDRDLRPKSAEAAPIRKRKRKPGGGRKRKQW